MNRERSAATGAVQSKTKFSDRSRSYWAHHRASCFGSLARLLSTPVQTLMTVMVVAIALALPATLLVVLGNLQKLGHSWDTNPKISVFINLRAKQRAVESLIADVESMAEVKGVEYLSQDEALRDFQAFSGFGEALESLDENPLPATLIVSPRKSFMSAVDLRRLADRIAEQSVVDEVNLDMDWVRRLQEFMRLGQIIVLALGGLLGLGVLLAVGNTIRLAIENRRDEILVTKLVGGTNGFVRRPFIYSGAWYGLMGGLMASLIVMLGYFSIEDTVVRLAKLYQSGFRLQGLGIDGFAKLVAVGGLFGWLGAWLAVGRHLAKIEPK